MPQPHVQTLNSKIDPWEFSCSGTSCSCLLLEKGYLVSSDVSPTHIIPLKQRIVAQPILFCFVYFILVLVPLFFPQGESLVELN